MDILTLLKRDHRSVNQILKEMLRTTVKSEMKRENLFMVLKEELTLHQEIEESIFYTTLKPFTKTHKTVVDSYKEHHVVDEMLEEIEETPVSDELWKKKIIALSKSLNKHISKEENTLFPKVKALFDKDHLREMGEDFLEMKERKKSLPGIVKSAISEIVHSISK